MVSKNLELLERVKAKVRSNDCNIHEARRLVGDYLDAVTAHKRGDLSLDGVARIEKALWNFLRE